MGGCPATVPGYDVSVTGRTASGVSETFQCDGFPWPRLFGGAGGKSGVQAREDIDSKTLQSIQEAEMVFSSAPSQNETSDK